MAKANAKATEAEEAAPETEATEEAPKKRGPGRPPKGERDPNKPEVTEIPEIRDDEGYLLKLTRDEFPKSREGRIAYIDYQIAKLQDKREFLVAQDDPKMKAQKKMERLQRQLAQLEAELAAMDEEEEGEDE